MVTRKRNPSFEIELRGWSGSDQAISLRFDRPEFSEVCLDIATLRGFWV